MLSSMACQLENLLSELLGRSPGPIPRGRSISDLTLAKVPAGIPSQLLERRPDLRAAEEQLIAAKGGDESAVIFAATMLKVTGDLNERKFPTENSISIIPS